MTKKKIGNEHRQTLVLELLEFTRAFVMTRVFAMVLHVQGRRFCSSHIYLSSPLIHHGEAASVKESDSGS